MFFSVRWYESQSYLHTSTNMCQKLNFRDAVTFFYKFASTACEVETATNLLDRRVC
jgi:hypothetical protein